MIDWWLTGGALAIDYTYIYAHYLFLMQMQGGSLIAWEYAADRQRECTVLGGRYSSKAVQKSHVEALKGVSRPMLHTVEEALASIFKVYWTNRDTDMKADGLLTQVGLLFKRAGKKLTKIM